MKKHIRKLSHFLGLWLVILLVACSPHAVKIEQARAALIDYFARLSNGQYEFAAQLYGGSYEILTNYNPEIPANDHGRLWQSACQVNGFQCLTVRTAVFKEITQSGEYLFMVEFETPDQELFTLPACCGENPTQPPQRQFEIRVVETAQGNFKVLDLPVYLP
jgi:UDP-N-acetyl-D-mannosaminuronic acid transferase (WecB/TagA/CpsF family)